MIRSAVRVGFLCALALAAAGCLPKIGDPCSNSLDCSQRGERLCDVTQPSGYCTVYNCEPDSCPDTATCVAFNHVLDPACGTTNDGSYPRFERTFCVWPCNEKNDCREGYDCIEVGALGGIVLDQKNPREKVCLVDLSDIQNPDQTGLPGICDPGEPGTLPTPYEPPTTSSAGTGGTGGTGAASASGGTTASGGTSGAAGGN
ncbi:MAG: hypothetical protein IPK82_34705 [Polyangiaceae bacterium]|nr:hypothetical protein [Polyangiaceae bacterium]